MPQLTLDVDVELNAVSENNIIDDFTEKIYNEENIQQSLTLKRGFYEKKQNNSLWKWLF